MESNGFALELAVGIKDLFTQTAKKVDAEVNKLDKDAKAMQKTFDDISAYKKTTKALEDLLQSGNATKDEIKQQEKALDELSKTLKKTGVDINNITKEEERLTRQVKDTNAELKKRSGLKDIIVGGIGAVASGGILKNFISSGNDIARLTLDMRNATNYTKAQITSQNERDFRAKMGKQYKSSQGEVMGVQTLLNQNNNLTGSQNQDATNEVLKLKRLMPKWGEEEIIAAISPMLKNGTSSHDAAAMLYSIGKRGDIKGDLLDTVQEYLPNLSKMGMTTEQFMAGIAAGKNAGAFNFDKVGDSLKESLRAQLTDQGNIDKLLGHGKTAGTIEEISDPKLKGELYAAIHSFQSDIAKNANPTGSLGNIYSIVGKIRNKDPLAARDITAGVAGVPLAEDIGAEGASSLGGALQNPNKSLGNYQSEFDNITVDDLLTPVEKTQAGIDTALQGTANAAQDLTGEFNGLATAVQNAGGGIAGMMNSHPVLSEVGAGLFSAVLLKGHVKSAMKVVKGIGGLMGRNAGKLPQEVEALSKGAIPAAEDIATTATKALKGGSGAKGLKLLSGKGNALLTVGIGGINAYNDYKDGNMKGVTGDVGGISGAIAGTEAGAVAGSALGTLLFPGVGTGIGGAIGGIAGGFLGEAAMKSLSESAYDWFNGDDSGKDSKGLTPDQQINKRIDDSAATADATTNVSGNGTPTVELNFNPQINIEALSASPDDISKAVEDALRQSNPELIQMLQYALEQVMANNDHQQASH